MQITKQGFYFNRYGKQVELCPDGPRSLYAVDLYSPNDLQAIVDNREVLDRAIEPQEAFFSLVDADSFEIALALEEDRTSCLVLNFANAHHPGGGFLHGSRAQEESLCRNSTLYASISSKKAAAMYKYNNALKSPVDSDYMLISPNVLVFRNPDCTLLDNPRQVAVATLPAPNKKNMACNVAQEELDRVMKDRLRKFLYAAAKNSYKVLVLGAWGCGAFGHDPNRVARYFYELFFDEGLRKYFELVIFAVLGGGPNADAFQRGFGDDICDCRGIEAGKSFAPEPKHDVIVENEGHEAISAICPAPICNHTTDVGKENLGYVQGILADGVPFEAELWENQSGMRCMTIIVPERPGFEGENRDVLTEGNVSGMQWQQEVQGDFSVLPIGMAIRDENISLEELNNYTDYFEEMGLVHFTSDVRNGSMRALTDIEGHDLMCDIIMLCEDGEEMAVTPLNFRPFPNQPSRPGPKLVMLRGGK